LDDSTWVAWLLNTPPRNGLKIKYSLKTMGDEKEEEEKETKTRERLKGFVAGWVVL
jgi:hypothetical protein